MTGAVGEEIVRLVNVVKLYRSGQVSTWGLRGVSLEVHRGDFISIMGPSGSGKSTLLNIMGLLDRPTSGHVYVKGLDVSKLSDEQLALLRNRTIGFVFQQYNLVGRLTVYENIEMPLVARGIPPGRRRSMVLEALKMVGGDPSWLRKKPTQLSGGQQQRVAIARAIVGRPEMILADEPTGNLDYSSSRVVVKTFVELNRAGLTIVVVTHNPEVAHCTNNIYILRDGRIVGAEKPERAKCIASS
ncbi:MAG: ABC transporter ATP-binding protein [Desulfurococcaceae archaeon]